MKASYDEEGAKVMARGDRRNGGDRTIGICMLLGLALGLVCSRIFDDASLTWVMFALGSVVGLALYYFKRRS